jgi:hypothetical protein
MTARLEDVMLETILRAVLRHPKNFPGRMVSCARRLRNVRREKAQARFAREVLIAEKNLFLAETKFKKQVVKHAGRLPEFLDSENPDAKVQT